MKTLEFRQYCNVTSYVTIVINDEEKFAQLCKEWIAQGQTLNLWDLEESPFDEVVTLEFHESDRDEDNNEFYDVMKQEGFPTDDEDVENLLITETK